jgi:hypothetical protein
MGHGPADIIERACAPLADESPLEPAELLLQQRVVRIFDEPASRILKLPCGISHGSASSIPGSCGTADTHPSKLDRVGALLASALTLVKEHLASWLALHPPFRGGP